MRYYIADCHFFHKALLENMDCRGFKTVRQMNEHMIRCWNRKVKPEDEVIVLGDLSWGSWRQTKPVLDRLHGRLCLIRGNHDRFLEDEAFDSRRFAWIRDYAELCDGNRKVILFHYPIACYNGQYRQDETAYMLHGHIHSTADQQLIDSYQNTVRQTMVTDAGGQRRNVPCHLINCFCVYSDYVPLSLDEWIENDRKRTQHKKGE